MRKDLPKVKRRSKQRYKSLEMREPEKKVKKSAQNNVKTTYSKTKKDRKVETQHDKVNENKQSTVVKEKKNTSQVINKFKEMGLTLIKGKKDSNIRVRRIIFPVVCIAIFLSVALIYFNAPTGFVEWVKTKSALSCSGSGFPIKYDLSTGKDLTYLNNQLFIVTDTDLKCYNNSGNLVYSRIHGYANPIIKTSKIRTLIYGVDSSQYKIETANEEVISNKTNSKQPIVAADISDSGVYAIATESNDDIAVVVVYDKNGTEIYKYHSSNYYVTGVTVSENGKKLCVSLLSTKNAKFISKVLIFDLNKTDPIFEKELSDEVIYNIEYSDNKNISVITDKEYLNLTADGINEKYNYNSDILNKFELSNDYILLYTTADTNSSNGKVIVFNLKGKQKANFKVEKNISDISASNNKVYILSGKVYEYDFDGELKEEYKTRNGATKIKAFKNKALVLYASGAELAE